MKNFYILIATIALWGCTGTQKNSVQKSIDNDQMTSGHTSQNSLDWAGSYRGILACSDCDGIEAVVTLTEDLTFKQKYRHLGKSGEPQETTGTFSWNRDGNRITLVPTGANDSVQYLVGENSLAQLDDQGNKVGGNDAGQHMLTKANYNILEKYWKLVELNGQAVSTDSTFRKDPHIIFKQSDSRITGNGGCNTIGGTYTVRGQNRLAVSNLFSTKMFCQNMDLETQFLTMLQSAESFNLNGDSLSLRNGQNNGDAKFVAVYMK